MLWHYTKAIHLPKIISSGYIDVKSLKIPTGEKPVAWFSRHPFWEPTVSFPWGMDGFIARGIVPCRVSVLPDAAPLNWTALRIQANISGHSAKYLLRVAKDCGANPLDWYGSLVPVPESQWQTIELFTETGWERLPDWSKTA